MTAYAVLCAQSLLKTCFKLIVAFFCPFLAAFLRQLTLPIASLWRPFCVTIQRFMCRVPPLADNDHPIELFR